MATSLLQVRIDDTLKNEASKVFENLGIDTSTAVRMFLKRAVLDNGIPFRMTLPKEPYSADRGYRAMKEISESAEKNGLSEMTLEEINAEIEASRKERAISQDEILSDPKDIVFYAALMEKRKNEAAYLVTGNLKHFPIRTYIVTPKEMLDIISESGK